MYFKMSCILPQKLNVHICEQSHFCYSIIVLNGMNTNIRKIKRHEVTLHNLDKKYIRILKQNLR